MTLRDALGHRRESWLLAIVAVVMFALGILPIASWVPGGHDAPWYGDRLDEWLSGAAIAGGLTVVLVILSRRLPLWRAGWWTGLAGTAASRPGVTGLVLGGLALAVYADVALLIFSGVPLHLDELAQLYQARTFASGALTTTLPEFPEFTSLMHLVEYEGKRFSQYPPGGPLMLVPGVLVRAPWLVSPVLGAASVWLVWAIARRIEAPGVALGAAVLFAVSPFVVFMSASHMNHVSALFWMLVATYGLLRALEGDASRRGHAMLAGFAWGMLATVRPVDALAYAGPGGLWLALRAWREGRVGQLIAAGVGVAAPLGALLWYNAQTTGSFALFAYSLQWGAEHGLGFHAAPWGAAHTPARGFELVNLYLLRLQSYLFETPLPSLVFPLLALGIARRVSAFDRYLLVGSALLLGLYFAYWHDGFYLGPRFVYLLTPVLALWTARLARGVRDRWPTSSAVHQTLVYMALASAGVAAVISVPARARSYQQGLRTMRHDVTGLAAQRNIRDALILVRESWGSQLIARLWARGISRPETEFLYRAIDACALDGALSDLERRQLTGAAAFRALLPLTADSLRLVPSTLSPDQSQRMLPGATYGAGCERRVREDQAGFTLLAPLLVRDWGGNLYARDLHARDSLLISAHPNRAVYLLRAESGEEGARLVFHELARDSLIASWSQIR